MLFNSIQFLFFFVIVTAAYWALPSRFRWPMLVAASCYFYMAFVPGYILVLFLLILIDYAAGLVIEPSRGTRRKAALIISLIANVAVLGIFKYYNFFNANFRVLWSWLGLTYQVPDFGYILPIGLSFHTFQSMSYTIEVYRGKYRAEHHLGIYALYVLFYPQMVAGPIERPQNLLHQFHEAHAFDYKRVTDGLKLMVWGLFKKAVVADRMAVIVNDVYANPSQHSGATLGIATYLFAFQIYCDFSGYSDMALGAAEVMGIRLMQNFKRPYLACSISEFWSRWHISLSTWFRDYVYIPLGGNRVTKIRWYTNLMIVFLVSGFWHGANWTFIVWGGLHGAYLVGAILTQSVRERIATFLHLDKHPRFHVWLQRIVVFHLALLAWVFFRATSVTQACHIIGAMLLPTRWGSVHELAHYSRDWIIIAGALIVMESIQGMQEKGRVRDLLSQQKPIFRWSAYACAVVVILLLGRFKNQDFIYFQF